MPDDRDRDLDLQGLHREHEPDAAFRAGLRARVIEELTTPTAGGNEEREITMLVEDERTAVEDEVLRRRSRRRRPLVWGGAAAAVALVVAAVAVGGRGGGDDEVDLADATAVYDDGYDAPGAWPKNPQPGFEVVTGGGQQIIRLGAGGLQILRAPDFGPARADMVVTVDVLSVSDGTTFGVACRKDPLNGEGSYYGFRLGPNGGELVVNKGGPIEVLATAPDVALPSSPFSMAISCIERDGAADIRAFVDGEEVVSVLDDDDPVPQGVAAVEVIAGPDGAEVTLDRLVASDASED